ncbi:uncharacterized protein LOC116415892 [Nasonia vitripennis]|uniref:Uncharacterized protein n=1 Tax=Nasonia vitripennis TaxID=7425 RepID=A0A7M7PX55_NASVI|nr:uncharacterized protein LOC116415892 [Nasonia vitripennis]
MRNADLLARRKKKDIEYVATEGDVQKLNWLSSNLEPWDQVEKLWQESFESRRMVLKNLQIHEYIEKFPCLKTQAGKRMFLLDFKRLYPNEDFIETSKWSNKIRPCLVEHLGKVNFKSVHEAALLEALKSNDLSEEKQNFVTLYLLPHIIPTKRSGKRKKDNAEPVERPHRLSLQERRESFILNVQTANDVQTRINDLKQRLLRSKLTFQPLIVAVGPETNIEKLYVAVNDQLYSINSILTAIKLAIAVFFFGHFYKGFSLILSYLQIY